MLKKLCTWSISCCHWDAFSPAAHASQVEINKQTGSQNASAVGTGNTVYQDLDQGSYQNQ